MDIEKDVIVIGGGQSGLACGYYLRRTDLDYLIVDEQEGCGGAWRHTWDSLTLFSPAEQSSLPGWLMPPSTGEFPTRQEVIQYLCQYEERYKLNIRRPVKVQEVHKEGRLFRIQSDQGIMRTKVLIAATGSWSQPNIPPIPGANEFEGIQIHSSEYRNPDTFLGKKVLVVGEGNSGAQIIADLSKTSSTSWATLEEPSFLPDDVDGRILFDQATAMYRAKLKSESFTPSQFTLGNIVMLPPVKEARDRGLLKSRGRINKIQNRGVLWEDGKQESFDAIIWCTGFKYATAPLSPLINLEKNGKARTQYTRSLDMEGLWMVGYGSWTGYASATIIGVGRSARQTIKEVENFLDQNNL